MDGKNLNQLQAPETCPVCGEEVPRGSLACPECGADHNSGWRENADSYGAAGLLGEDFDYDEFVAQEFGSSPKPGAIRLLWWMTAILLIVALVLIYFYGAH